MQFTDPERVEEKIKAAEGVHEIKLLEPEECHKKGWNFIRFPFVYTKEVAEVPNEFCLFDLPVGYSDKQYKDFCRRVTQLRDCFDFDGTLYTETLSEWKDKIGRVEIEENKKGFLVVKQFLSAR